MQTNPDNLAAQQHKAMSSANCVGFYMETSFHYRVYENIIDALLKLGYQCHLIVNDLLAPEYRQEMVDFIKNLPRSDLCIQALTSVVHAQDMSENKEPYACIVSPYYAPALQDIKTRHHVRAIYGLAKDRWGHEWWNVFYDKVLCYGEHTYQRLNIYNTGEIVGNPRFDSWHRHTFDTSLAKVLKRDPERPVVLYAPTFGELSSLPDWAEKLSQLQKETTLLLKLHHRTQIDPAEHHALSLAQQYFKCNLISHQPLFPLLHAADFVLTDSSGFIFDALHAGKKTILLSSPRIAEQLAGGETYSDKESADQTVKQVLPEVTDISGLRDCLFGEYDWHSKEVERADYRHRYCDGFQDGYAGERAAKVIVNLIEQGECGETNFLLQSLRAKLF